MKKEIWKEIKGFKGLYLISTKGRVKSLTVRSRGGWIKEYEVGKEKVLKPGITNDGYQYVKLTDMDGSCTRHYIHHLVAKQWIKNRENKRCINHINGIKTDNSLVNLEWVTHKENVRHNMKLNAERGIDTQKRLRDFVMIDLHTNSVVARYDCMIDVRDEYPEIDLGAISRILNGKRKTTLKKKYTFQWV